MKAQFMFVVVFALFDSNCFQKSKKKTVELDYHLYVENFNINPFGVDEVYLTDSLNFKVYVGKYDVEHERYTFVYKKNNIIVYKKAKDANGKWRKVDSLLLSRE